MSSAATGTLEVVSSHEVSYDDAGRVAGRTAEVSGLGSWRECYGYDRRSRLESAFTVAASATCAGGTAGTGDQPFDQEFAYSAGNALLERTEGGATTGYDYDDTGADPPYAPVTVGGVTLEWDPNGNLTERTEGAEIETFTWDVEQRLVSVSGPGGESSFVYDPAGQRLLRRTAEGSTLYFAGQEITASQDGSTVTGVRSYSFAGSLVATRGAAGVDYLITDERGSVEMGAPSLGVPSASRAYVPYGQEHAASGSGFATDRGFLSQVEDESTSLSYLNARYYDAESGVFVSPDPVYDTGNPKSLNPYTYGLGNPTTFSDASGLSPSYVLGIENQNIALGRQNRQLIAHIGRLSSQLSEMQNIIVEQRNMITELLTHISALDAIIHQQAVIIRNLQSRVRELEAQVNYWRGRAYYYRSRAAELVGHVFSPTRAWYQMLRIDRGLSIQFEHSRVTQLQGQLDAARLREAGDAWADRSRDNRISRLDSDVEYLEGRNDDLVDEIEQSLADVEGGGGSYGVRDAYCDANSVVSASAAAVDIIATHDPVTEVGTDAADATILVSGAPCTWDAADRLAGSLIPAWALFG